MSYEITSPTNQRVKRLVRLRQRRHRDDESLFVVEEPRIFDRAVTRGHVPAEVFVCPDLFEGDDPPEAVTISPEAIHKASYRSASTGLIALFPYFSTDLDSLRIDPEPLILVAEGIEKPGNLGALLRIADGAGVAAVLLVDSETDVFNPNSVRASTGALFTVSVARVAPEEAEDWLTSQRLVSVAASPSSSLPLWDADLTGRCAIWIGAESAGLSDRALRFADVSVSIPMAGWSDSLNASVSAGLLLYESVRQRRDQV